MKKNKNWKWSDRKIKAGDFYVDCGYIPRFCVNSSLDDLEGISLLDRTRGFCSHKHCTPTWISRITANQWMKTGPISKEIKQRLKDFYASEWGNGRQIWWNE
jgi:hypothetical protein